MGCIRVLGLAFLLCSTLSLVAPVASAGEPRWPPEDPKEYKSLVEAARRYFDLEEELWVGRKHFLRELEAHAQGGTFHLKDMEGLRWLVGHGGPALARLPGAFVRA
jgi:hypothetical protein